MDQSTEAFLASLRRFSGIYGAPQEIHSDNGSNFVGANREHKNIYELLKKDETQCQLHHWSASRDISWSFTPSRVPHFGSLWESAVRLMKLTLTKVIDDQILWADELTTLLYEAAAICNSRPLAPMETHTTDGVKPLTPGHFLTGARASRMRHHTVIYLWKKMETPSAHDFRPLEMLENRVSSTVATTQQMEIHVTQSVDW